MTYSYDYDLWFMIMTWIMICDYDLGYDMTYGFVMWYD